MVELPLPTHPQKRKRHWIARPADRLRAIAEPVSMGRGALVYRQGDPADRLYEIAEGVVKTYSELPGGRTCITAFLFPGDLFGLSEDGRYIHSAAAVVHARLNCVPVDRLTLLMHSDPALDCAVLCKLCHELREAERHELLLARSEAPVRLAAFIAMLLRVERKRKARMDAVFLPMSRGDIADYISITREALSRAFKTLANAGILTVPDRHHVCIADQAAFAALAAKLEPVHG